MSSSRSDLSGQLADQLMRAMRLLQQGDYDAAETVLENVLAIDRQNPVALHLLGAASLQLGEVEEAIERIGESLAINPNSAAANCDLGLALTAVGRLDEGCRALEKAVQLRPDFAEAWFNLGRTRLRLGNRSGALSDLRQALARKPDFADARLMLALLLIEDGRLREADAELREAIRRRPEFGPAWRQLGRLLDALGNGAEAEAALRRAAELMPGDAAVWAELGDTLTAFGRIEAAIPTYQRALELAPGNAEWRRLLAMLSADLGSIDDIRAALADPGRPAETRAQSGFALAQLQERQGDVAAAAESLRQANALKRRTFTYLPMESERAFADIREAFSRAIFEAHEGAGSDDETPIFVLGMPRSGTTLVEQILASHPDVFGAGELPILRNLVAAAAGGADVHYATLLAGLDDAGLTRLGRDYIRQLRGYSQSARHITDKMPGNFLLIGFIKLCLPRARVIHCVRDPLDTCWSIYRNYFSSHLGYAYDVEELGHYYRLYRELMAHWHAVLPGFVYDIGYEALVADQEGETRRLLAHCGLDFRDACLRFNEAPRAVHTASAVQIRRPMTAASVGAAGPYQAWLEPLRAALDGRR